ncbi:MAG: hopanoid biosynthesis-associated protein HpnK [Verrucomicrobia subdivision 3 bacterium]|nr:hopanoid biosynthesis-associated protein HpnK [Limisphaerales bacterium]
MALVELPTSVAAPEGSVRITTQRRLVINADDFGRSAEVNAAIIRAHTEGVLTCASLMVNEEGFEEAVELARKHPTLGVGLHLTLVCGHSALAQGEIPGLVNLRGAFRNEPVAAGMRYFFDTRLRAQLTAEIDAQFEKFLDTGLHLDHVNGHLHFHVHPTVFRLLMEIVLRRKARAVRLSCDPFWLNARLADGRWGYRVFHGIVFGLLSRRARRVLTALRIRHTPQVFGLLQDSQVDEVFISRLLRALPPGDSELYSHPSLTQFKHELDALMSPRVKALISDLQIKLVRYQDL